MKDTLFTLLRVLLVAIPLAAFATGLRVQDPLWLWKRPRLLVRSLLAILVVVPVLATLLVEVLRPAALIRAGLVVSILSVGIGPSDVLKRTRASDARLSYEVGLEVVLLPLAVVYIPAAVALHGVIFQHDVLLDAAAVAEVVLTQMLVPLALGFAFARAAPELAGRLRAHLERFVDIALLVLVGFAALVAWRGLWELGAAAWATCAVVAASAILAGHALSAGERDIRSSLVAFSVLRFPGLALVFVAAIPEELHGERLIPVVLAYVLTSALLLAAYTRVASIVAARTGARGGPTARAAHRPNAPG